MGSIRKSFCIVALGAWLSGLPTAAVIAQDDALEEIVVTGSRIRRQDFSANSPITTVTTGTFEETSTVGIETVLNQLPQFVPAVTQFTTDDVANTATNTVGASTVSLRGLGPNRNLVLIDGRRGQPVNAALVVDTNSIPAAAIERVEVISGGASAVYGADAVGGVVNFILKEDFEGANVDVRYGETQAGDNEELTVSALVGANVAGDRGNVMLGISHSSRGVVLAKDRDWQREEWADPDVPGNDFWFSETFVTSVSPGNAFPQAAIDSVFSELPPGTIPPNAQFMINPTPDGTGTVFTGAGAFTGATGAAGASRYTGPLELEGYEGITWRKYHPNGQLSQNAIEQWLSIPLDRYSAFAKGRFDVSDGLSVFTQAMFSRSSSATLLRPASALNQNSAIVPYGSEIYEPSLAEDGVTTNPAYLPGGVYGLNCPPIGGCTESEAFPLPPEMRLLLDSRPNPNDDIRINRSLDLVGYRSAQTETSTFQLTFGLEGEAFGDSVWDAHVSHGQTELVVSFDNMVARERWRSLVASPNFGVAFLRQGNEQANGFSAGIATCTSGLPLVRDFEMSDDCRAALVAAAQNTSHLEQNVFEANLTGTLARMRAGDLQYALGGAYREDEYRFKTDTLTTNESFLDQGLGIFPTSNTFGSFDVTEIYGELLVPIASDAPGVEHLNLELGGRHSDYSTVGGVQTYKALIDWAVTPRARIRGGYNLATRAPNLGELFLSRTQVFLPGSSVYGDQCSQNNESGPYSANPAANVNGASGAAHALEICRGMMGATGAAEYYGRPIADQPEAGNIGPTNTTGNPNLDSEEAETFTLGAVVSFLDAFTVSVDYYEIEIKDMIAVESPDAVSQRCLSPEFNPDADPNVPACRAMLRDPISGNAAAIDLTYTNQGRALTSGVDLQLDWAKRFANGSGLNVNVLANYNLKNITQESPELEETDWAGTLGCALQLQCMGYDYRIFSTFNYFKGPWAVSLRWQHWPSIKAATYATDPLTDDIGVTTSYDLFALSTTYQFRDRYTLRAGIENLFDKDPPRSGGDPNASNFPQEGTRAAGATYDPLGRRAFVSVTMRF